MENHKIYNAIKISVALRLLVSVVVLSQYVLLIVERSFINYIITTLTRMIVNCTDRYAQVCTITSRCASNPLSAYWSPIGNCFFSALIQTEKTALPQ